MWVIVFEKPRVVVQQLTRCIPDRVTQRQGRGRSEWLTSRMHTLRKLGLGVGPVATDGDHRNGTGPLRHCSFSG